MAKLINLLPEISPEQKKKDIRLWYLNIGAISLLLIAGLVLVGLYAFKAYTQSQLDKTNADISEVKQQISKESEVVNLVTFINSKIKKITSQWPRLDHSADLTRAVSFLPDSVKVTGFQQTAMYDYLLTATTKNLPDIDTVIDTLKTQGQEKFRNYQMRSILRDDASLYTFNVSFQARNASGSAKQSSGSAQVSASP